MDPGTARAALGVRAPQLGALGLGRRRASGGRGLGGAARRRGRGG